MVVDRLLYHSVSTQTLVSLVDLAIVEEAGGGYGDLNARTVHVKEIDAMLIESKSF